MKAMLLIPLEFSTLNGLELKISLPGIASEPSRVSAFPCWMAISNDSHVGAKWEPGLGIILKFLGVAKVGAAVGKEKVIFVMDKRWFLLQTGV